MPHYFLDLTDKMNLFERLQNYIFFVAEDVLMKLFHYNAQQEIYETGFPTSKTFRPFWDKLKHGVSLVKKLFHQVLQKFHTFFFKVLLNSHYSISFARPYFPNLVSETLVDKRLFLLSKRTIFGLSCSRYLFINI